MTICTWSPTPNQRAQYTFRAWQAILQARVASHADDSSLPLYGCLAKVAPCIIRFYPFFRGHLSKLYILLGKLDAADRL